MSAESLFLTSANLPEFDDRQIQLICEVFGLPVSTYCFYLTFEMAFVQKMLSEEKTNAEKLKLLIIIFDIVDEIEAENPNREMSLTLRKLIFFGIFGGQYFASNDKGISEFCAILNQLMDDKVPKDQKRVLDVSLFALTPFIQERVKKIPGYLVECVIRLMDYFEIGCSVRCVRFFASVCCWHDGTVAPDVFENMLSRLRKCIANVNVRECFPALKSSLQRLFLPSGRMLSPRLVIQAFNILVDIMKLDNAIRDKMCRNVACFVDYVKYVLSQITVENVTVSHYVFEDKLLGKHPCSGPIERTLANDFQELADEVRPTKVNEAPIPRMPTKCTEGKDMKDLLDSLQAVREMRMSVQIAKSLVENRGAQHPVSFVYFLCAFIGGLSPEETRGLLPSIDLFSILLDGAFHVLNDQELKDYVMDLIFQLAVNYPNEEPRFLMSFLSFVYAECRTMTLTRAISDTVIKVAQASETCFIRACKSVDWNDKMKNVLLALSGDKESATKLEVLRMLDQLNSFPLVFSYLFESPDFCPAVLLYFYDPSTWRFAMSNVSFAFRLLRASSRALCSVVQFTCKIPFNEQGFLCYLDVIKEAFNGNRYEINMLFNTTNLLQSLLDIAESIQTKEVMAALLHVCASLNMYFELFSRLEVLLVKHFPDEEMVNQLFRIVFRDDLGMSTPRKFVDPHPLTFLCRILQKNESEFEKFVGFVDECLNLDSTGVYELATLEFPAQLIEYLSRFRKSPTIEPMLKKVLDLLGKIYSYAVQPRDLILMFRLLTSLPGHERPCFTTEVLSVMSKICGESLGISDFFCLDKPGDNIRLPVIPMDVINGQFAIIVDIRWTQPLKDIEGTLLEFSSDSEQLSITFHNGELSVRQVINGTPTSTGSFALPLVANEWTRVAVSFPERDVEFVIKRKHYFIPFSRVQFRSQFTDFVIAKGLMCHVASVIVMRQPVRRELQLLSCIHRKVTSFHSSEGLAFGQDFSPLFTNEFRSKVLTIINACVTHDQDALNLVSSSVGVVTGTTCHTNPKPIDALGSAGSALVFLPLFGQLDQPTLSVDGPSRFVFDPTLLPSIIHVLEVVFKASEMHQIIFNQANGFGMLGFLLTLSGDVYMNEETVAAICELFKSLNPSCAASLIADVMWNIQIWSLQPIEFQLKAYKAFWNVIEERLQKEEREIIAQVNVRSICTMMRLFFWESMTNRRICLLPNQVQSPTDPRSFARPESLKPVRGLFWEIARVLSGYPIADEDIRFIISCCCVTGDIVLSREMLDFVVYLLSSENKFVLNYMKTHPTFREFFVLLAFPDVVILWNVANIFLLMARHGEVMLAPYTVSQWIARMVTTIVAGKVTKKFARYLYHHMIGCSPSESRSPKDSEAPGLKYPEVIPLLLMSILELKPAPFKQCFNTVARVMARNLDSLERVPFCDHSFLLVLMQQCPKLPSDSPVVTPCIELLSMMYRYLLMKNGPERGCLLLPHVVTMISSNLKMDYTHIVRLIFKNMLDKTQEISDQISPSTLVEFCFAVFRFIFVIPATDQWFSWSHETKNYGDNPTFQTLFQALIKADTPSISFAFTTRTNLEGEWRDAELAHYLVKFMINKLGHLATADPKDVSKLGKAFTYVLVTGLQHKKYTDHFATLVPPAFKEWMKIPHQKLIVSALFGGLIKVVLQLPSLQALFLRLPEIPNLVSFLKQHAKLPFTDFQSLFQDGNLVPWAMELVETNAKNDEASAKREVKEVDDEYKTVIQTISKRNAVFVSKTADSGKRSSSGFREMSTSDQIYISLEQSATECRHKVSQAAKSYRRAFYTFSTDFGPWQPPEYVPDVHRKLSSAIFGNCRFFMKKNRAFSIHKEASLARDAIDGDIDPDYFQKQLAKGKMTEFVGDSAIVAAVSAEKSANVISGRVLLKCAARYITLETTHSGTLSLTDSTLFFDSPGKFFSISVGMIRAVFHRLCLLVDSAVEIFTIAKRSFFIDFPAKQRTVFLRTLRSLNLPRLKFFQMKRSDINDLVEKAMQRWQKCEISNFTLLMKLNKYAGRSYNDLSQYPVMPWVISDYSSETLDLNSPTSFRDLGKPIGALCPERLEDCRKRYEFAKEFEQNELYLYGAFYSSPAVVIWYLLRTEPFTTLHVKLQSGKFDLAARIFQSIPAAWESCSSGAMDFRELIPEFFYMPDFLVNENNNDLGVIPSTGKRVSDVELPKWAESPRDFIVKNRAALESPYVSSTLHQWLDLIFGPKSRGACADAADNLFHPFFYEETLLTADAATLPLIKEYGACFGAAPRQLFGKSPPGRSLVTIPLHQSISTVSSSNFGNPLANTAPILALYHDQRKSVVHVVDSRLQYVCLALPHLKPVTPVLLKLPIPENLADVAEIGVNVAISEKYVIVALPWETAFFIFDLCDVCVPKYVCRAHTERLSSIAVAGDIFLTCARDRSFCIWRAGETSLVPVASILKHRTPAKTIAINHKLKICVGIGQRGFMVSASTVTGEYLGGKSIGISDPSHVAISDFGSIAVCSTQGDKSTIIVVDQNLVHVCRKEIPGVVKCWKCVSWNDGSDYLVIGCEDRRVMLYRLPFLEELPVNIEIGGNPVAMEVIRSEHTLIMISDDKGGLWLIESLIG